MTRDEEVAKAQEEDVHQIEGNAIISTKHRCALKQKRILASE